MSEIRLRLRSEIVRLVSVLSTETSFFSPANRKNQLLPAGFAPEYSRHTLCVAGWSRISAPTRGPLQRTLSRAEQRRQLLFRLGLDRLGGAQDRARLHEVQR